MNFVIVNPLDPQVAAIIAAGRALFQNNMEEYLVWAQEYEKRNRTISVSADTATTAGETNSELTQAIVRGRTERIEVLTDRLLKTKIKPQLLIDKHISRALHIVGDNYESGKMFIPDLLHSAEAAKRSLAVIRRHMPGKRKKGRILLATVQGDIHDIGKNIAGMVFESAGYEVIDLGKDVLTRRIIEAVKRHKPEVLGLSP